MAVSIGLISLASSIAPWQRRQAVMAGVGFFERHSNVYVYVPNLIGASFGLASKSWRQPHPQAANAVRWLSEAPDRIVWPFELLRGRLCDSPLSNTLTPPPFARLRAGYGRVACALYAFAVAQSHPVQCVVSYFLGCVSVEPCIAQQDPTACDACGSIVRYNALDASLVHAHRTAGLCWMRRMAGSHGSSTRRRRWGLCSTWSPTGASNVLNCQRQGRAYAVLECSGPDTSRSR